MSKIDVSLILSAHIRTLRDNRFGDRLCIADLIVFFAIPSLLGAALVGFRFGFRTDAVSGFLNAFAILTGLLLNLLVLVFTLASAAAPLNMDIRKRKILLTEIFSNVCFCLLVAIAVVCVAVVALSYMRSNPGAVTGKGATFLLGFLTANFVLTILMVIKRMFVLLTKEIDKAQTNRAA